MARLDAQLTSKAQRAIVLLRTALILIIAMVPSLVIRWGRIVRSCTAVSVTRFSIVTRRYEGHTGRRAALLAA